MPQFNPDIIRERIRQVALGEIGLSESMAADVAFHMTDWLDDLESYHRFCSDPCGLGDEEVSRLLMQFLVHMPNHIAAATKLYTNVPVTDIFGVGALSEENNTAPEQKGPDQSASRQR